VNLTYKSVATKPRNNKKRTFSCAPDRNNATVIEVSILIDLSKRQDGDAGSSCAGVVRVQPPEELFILPAMSPNTDH
jgi:hypothetical protein